MIQFRTRAPRHCEVFAVWKKNQDQRLIIDGRIPKTAFEAPDPVALGTGQPFARVNVDTNDRIYVSGVDTQKAFNATGLPEPFLDMFALDPVEAWGVDFARVVDQGLVDSWNDVVYSVLAVVPMGWYHVSLQRVDSLIFVAMPPLSPLVHTEYVDNFVGLSQQESVARDPKRVSDALVKAGLWSPRGRDAGLGFRSKEAGCRRRWRLRTATLHVASREVGRARTKLARCWPLHVSGFGAERAPGYFQCGLPILSTRRPTETTLMGRSRTSGYSEFDFLAHRDLSAPSCPEVSLFDASPWEREGCGGCRFGTS